MDGCNTVYRFSVSGGGIGVPPGTGIAPVGKRDPAQLPNIFGGRRFSGADVCGPAPVPPRGHQQGGVTGKADISLETGPAVCTLFAQIQPEGIREIPTSL